jgi:hypothetical protein
MKELKTGNWKIRYQMRGENRTKIFTPVGVNVRVFRIKEENIQIY